MHRCPVIATDVGGVGELIENGFNGRLVAPGDPQGLAGAVAAGDPEAARAMAEHAYEKVRGSYTFEAQAKRWHALYEELAGMRAAV